MRIEDAKAKRGSRARLVGAVAGLALVAGALLAAGGAPTKHATSSIEAVKHVAAASTTPGTISPREEIADRDSLELQLD